MLSKEDSVRLRHMLEAARAAMSFVRGRTRCDLGADQMLSFAVVRAIEVLGEAASKVSPGGRALAANIPWPSVTGMRHRLVHAYFDINLDLVWDTVTQDLPPLISELERTLEAHTSEQ